MNEAITELLTAREVSERLAMSQIHVTSLFTTGRITAYKTKLGWLASPSSVEAYAQERATMPTRRAWNSRPVPQLREQSA